MKLIINHGKYRETKRWLCSLALATIQDLPTELDLPSKYFVLLVAMDARQLANKEIYPFAELLIKQGAAYICTWGPDCERVHDVFDLARGTLISIPTDSNTIMTSWHTKDSLDKVLWFAIDAAWPVGDYWDSCKTVLLISVGNDEWARQIVERSRRAERQRGRGEA